MARLKNRSIGCSITLLLFYIYLPVCWVVNLIKFINCDFTEPYKEEIIHGIGVFLALPSAVTAWF